MAEVHVLPDPARAPIVTTTRLFVEGLRVMAPIGIHAHERLAPQHLVIDVELEVPAVAADGIDQTFDYELICDAAQAVIAQGHVDLVENFARRVAYELFAAGRVDRLMIRVTKPGALQPAAASAGVELCLRRD